MLSMTGYGRASLTIDGRAMTIELKSVNHRFLDLSFRMPRNLLFLEDDARSILTNRLARGHVEVMVTYRNTRTDSKIVTVDTALAGAYMKALNELSEGTEITNNVTLTTLSNYPDVLTVTDAEEDEEAVKALFEDTMNAAIDKLIEMRAVEGEKMKNALLTIMSEIEQKSYIVDERYPQTVEEYRKKLTDRLNELLDGKIDPARIAQEVAIMADKAAVDEETVRLRSHIAHAREKCEGKEPAGRALDFLVQEMNREVNTISSKSQDVPITDAVLACKSAIEKLREQLQNVE